MNTTQLECFMAVANFLNFSRAAESLRLTQPAVSHQISALEDEMGVRLFHRTSKSVRLTQEGYLFTQYAGEILKLSNLSKARLREAQQAQPLHLGIGCRSASELQLVQKALKRFRQQEPNLLPILRLIPFDSLENLLEDGEIQMMFCYQEAVPRKAAYRELGRLPIACMCAQDDPLATHEQLTLQDLRNAGRIATFRPSVFPPALFHIQSQIISGRMPDQMLFCDNLEVLHTLVSAGFGFAVVADCPQVRQPGLKYIPLPEFEPLSFGAAYLSGAAHPVLRQFLSLLESLLRQGAEA